MMHTLPAFSRLLAECAKRSWSELEGETVSPYRETTITDMIVRQMVVGLKKSSFGGAHVVQHAPRERDHGADLEWWVVGPGKTKSFAARLQAKKRASYSRAGYRYEELLRNIGRRAERQVDALIDNAGEFHPLYVFYNEFDPNFCATNNITGKTWGCAVADARAVRLQALVNRYRGVKDQVEYYLPFCLPWHEAANPATVSLGAMYTEEDSWPEAVARFARSLQERAADSDHAIGSILRDLPQPEVTEQKLPAYVKRMVDVALGEAADEGDIEIPDDVPAVLVTVQSANPWPASDRPGGLLAERLRASMSAAPHKVLQLPQNTQISVKAVYVEDVWSPGCDVLIISATCVVSIDNMDTTISGTWGLLEDLDDPEIVPSTISMSR